ncbi:MAG: GntR family transcriptional regulator, partial [Spirochaetes bacterium]|nr:GntR family transcriptional regulator [Spirochaetota bacterium]
MSEHFERVVFDNRQIPLHYQIADYLLMMLENGSLRHLDRLPPEEELKRAFGVSRMTVRHALDHLIQKGLLYRKQGRGTFWTEKASSVPKGKLSGINREIFRITEKTEVRVLSKRDEPASGEVADFLRVPAGAPITVFERLRTLRGEPMSYSVNYLPVRYGHRIGRGHLERMTMMETLERILKIPLGTVEHVVEITRAGAETARHLKVPVLDPVLTVKTTILDGASEPLE